MQNEKQSSTQREVIDSTRRAIIYSTKGFCTAIQPEPLNVLLQLIRTLIQLVHLQPMSNSANIELL